MDIGRCQTIGLSGKRRGFSAAVESGAKGSASRYLPVPAHNPLRSARSSKPSRGRAKMAEGEPSDKVRETADAAASFKSDMWRRRGFPVSRNEKGGKLTERQETTPTTLLFAHVLVLVIKSLRNNSTFTLFQIFICLFKQKKKNCKTFCTVDLLLRY